MELTQQELDRIQKEAVEYAKIFNEEYRYIAAADYIAGAIKEHKLAYSRYEFIKKGVIEEMATQKLVQKTYYNTLDTTSKNLIAERDKDIITLKRICKDSIERIKELESEYPRYDLIRDYRVLLTNKDKEIEKLKTELPDIYTGDLNTERIKTYRKYGEHFFGNESIIRDSFCRGADWYKSLLTTKK
jgi:hypothetical protein